MADRPRIALLLDENTSGGCTRYDMSKAYFTAMHRAGGLPFGIPYFADMTEMVADTFDGFVAVGGRFAYPLDWYLPGQVSPSPESERFPVEQALMVGFLGHDKPVLGICAGMQMLACLHGARLTPDVRALGPGIGEHDRPGAEHPVRFAPGSALASILGPSLTVNSFHREAVAEVPAPLLASGHAEDGVVEAIEVPGRRFAVGLQWHQELLAPDHPGHRIFAAMVAACR
jgi:putative glutamine amidotransferase